MSPRNNYVRISFHMCHSLFEVFNQDTAPISCTVHPQAHCLFVKLVENCDTFPISEYPETKYTIIFYIFENSQQRWYSEVINWHFELTLYSWTDACIPLNE